MTLHMNAGEVELAAPAVWGQGGNRPLCTLELLPVSINFQTITANGYRH